MPTPLHSSLLLRAFHRNYIRCLSSLPKSSYNLSWCKNSYDNNERKLQDSRRNYSSAVFRPTCYKCCKPCTGVLFYFSRTLKRQTEVSWFNDDLQKYIKKFKAKYESEATSGKEKSRLQHPMDIIRDAEKIEQEMRDLKELVKGKDEDLSKLAKEDIVTANDKLLSHAQQLISSLAQTKQKFPTRGRGVVIEVSAGVGGQEAMLFSLELWNMYSNFALAKGWRFSALDYVTTEIGGLRQGSALIEHPTDDVHSLLQYEGGIHRVQRVPKTEKTGRIHTSTAAVAVLLQPHEVDIVINAKDLRVDTMRASGAGGQNVQKTESAVRLTHLPTGLMVECQTGRSQHHNKQEALQKLRALLYQRDADAQNSNTSSTRRLQVGSRSRSEKIRTYNVPQDRVTDHRINFTSHNVNGVLDGGTQLHQILENIKTFSEEEEIATILNTEP